MGDDFERAIQAVPKGDEKALDSEAVLKTLVEGNFRQNLNFISVFFLLISGFLREK